MGIRALAVGTTVVLAGAAFAVLAALPADVWAGQRPATCLATSCFCEAFGPGPVKQPVNAASSLAFVVAAGVVLAGTVTIRPRNGPKGPESALPDRSRDDLSHRPPAVALAAILAFIGLGSAVYHAAFTFGAQFADVLGMHLLTALMLALAVRRAARLGRGATWVLFALLAGASAVALWAFPEVRRVLFGILLVIALTLEVALNLRAGTAAGLRTLGAGVAVFALAYLFWVLDETRTLCAPESPFQGHAAWHLLGAIAAVVLARHYARSVRT